MTAAAPQRPHRRREGFNGARWITRAGAPWRMLPTDLPPWAAVSHQPQRWVHAGVFAALVHAWRLLVRLADGRTAQPAATLLERRTLPSSPARGPRASDDGAKRQRGSQVQMAGDTLGPRLALPVTPAPEQDRAQVAQSPGQVHEVTGEAIDVACVDRGDPGDPPAQAAAAHGMHLDVGTLPDAKHGFGLRPRRWVVERRFAGAARVRRLARDDARLPATRAGFQCLAFAILWLTRFVALMGQRA